jgi:hypothetical protein
MNSKKIIIQNIENYRASYEYSSVEYIKNYMDLINEYLTQCNDKIFLNNVTYYKYAVIRGMHTLGHIYSILLLYTKNIDIAQYHCHKSLYYYIEFISQIGDNNNTFLQLNSTDAILFILKKTIFDINIEHLKNTPCDNLNILENIKLFITIHNKIIEREIQNYKANTEKYLNKLVKMKTIQNILNLYIKNSDESCFADSLKICELFLNNIEENSLFPIFLKKLLKNPFTYSKLKTKINNNLFIDKKLLNNNTTFINWLFV